MPVPVPLNDLQRHFKPLEAELNAALAEVVAGGRYILGQACEAFEAEFARYIGAQHGIGVANGTDALELALRAAEIGLGMRVATVANGGMYGTAAILAVGARPVYVDIDPVSLTMAPEALSAAGKVDAVIATHLYGRMADMPAILKIASGKPVIEDCAQAHGAALEGRRAGSFGLAGCFSFYPTKNLGAIGDGGAVVTSDAAIAARLRKLRQYGWNSRYHAELPGGRNSRLDEIQAAALRVMLPHLDGWNRERRRIAARYRAGLANDQLQLPSEAGGEGAHVMHLYVLRCAARDALKAALSAAGIGADIHYPVPDYAQPVVQAVIGRSEPLPETERAVREILTIPCFHALTDREAGAVIAAIQGFFRP